MTHWWLAVDFDAVVERINIFGQLRKLNVPWWL